MQIDMVVKTNNIEGAIYTCTRVALVTMSPVRFAAM